MKEITVWGIHAGKTGDAESLFFKNDVIAIGWEKVDDLSKLKANREAFKEAVAKAYPDKKPSSIPIFIRDTSHIISFLLSSSVFQVTLR